MNNQQQFPTFHHGGIYHLGVPKVSEDRSVSQGNQPSPQEMAAHNLVFRPTPPPLAYPMMMFHSGTFSQNTHQPSVRATSEKEVDRNRQEFEKQLNLQRQRVRLQQIGAGSGSHIQSNPESMIASIVGPTVHPKQKSPSSTGQQLGLQEASCYAVNVSSDLSLPLTISGTTTQEDMKCTSHPGSSNRPGIETIMKQCADLSLSGSKPKAFHKTTLNQIQRHAVPTQHNYIPDNRASSWDYKQAESLEGIFILPTTQVRPTIQGGYVPCGHRLQQGTPSGVMSIPGAHLYSQPNLHSHLPEWILWESVLPPLYRQWLSLCGNSDFPDTGLVYSLLLKSGLPREVLGHIWSLVNRTILRQLTKPEFYAALILVALAQEGRPFTLEALASLDCKNIPVPKLAVDGGDFSDITNIQGSGEQQKTSVTVETDTGCLQVPVNEKRRSNSEDEFGEFTNFRATAAVLDSVAAAAVNESEIDRAATQQSSPVNSRAVQSVSFGGKGEHPLGVSTSGETNGSRGNIRLLEPVDLNAVEHFPIKSIVSSELNDNSPGSGSVKSESKEPSVHSLDLKSLKSSDDIDENTNTALFASGVPENVTALPPVVNMFDKYAAVKETEGDVELQDQHVSVWMKCLSVASRLLKQGVEIFSRADSSSVCKEVLSTEQGSVYFRSIIEIYRVVCRIRISIKTMTFQTEKMVDLLNDIDLNWDILQSYAAGSDFTERLSLLDFGAGMVCREHDDEKSGLCGVCLLNVDKPSNEPKAAADNYKLEYGGRRYHSQCANLWVNCIDSLLPALDIPVGLL